MPAEIYHYANQPTPGIVKYYIEGDTKAEVAEMADSFIERYRGGYGAWGGSPILFDDSADKWRTVVTRGATCD